MTKSQLMIEFLSKKLDRNVSPIRWKPKSLRLQSRSSARITFIRAVGYVNDVIRSAQKDAGSVPIEPGFSTHLVTINVTVSDGNGEHVSSTSVTLHSAAYVLLCRYFARFTDEARRGPKWLSLTYDWCPLVMSDRHLRKEMDRSLRSYE